MMIDMLVERMIPEKLETLKRLEAEYPYSIGAVIKELEVTEYWHYLSYASVMELASSLTGGDCSPTAISKLFKS